MEKESDELMGLYEHLAETYPSEFVEPYGEVLVVPSKAFKQEWREQLESEGVQIFSNAFMGKTCFFLRKKPQTQPNGQTELEKKPANKVSRFKPWSEEEEQTLLKLKSEGLTFEAIAAKLGKTPDACYIKWKRLMAKNQKFPEAPGSNPGETNGILEEFLSALNLLCKQHKRVCLTMLRNASLFLEGEKP